MSENLKMYWGISISQPNISRKVQSLETYKSCIFNAALQQS